MVSFVGGLLIGCGIGLVVVLPLFIWIYSLVKDTLERRNIKRMIKKGDFLSPIDKKDFDQATWQEINVKKDEQNLKDLDKRIFNRGEIILAKPEEITDKEQEVLEE
jgi:hypothetical protein